MFHAIFFLFCPCHPHPDPTPAMFYYVPPKGARPQFENHWSRKLFFSFLSGSVYVDHNLSEHNPSLKHRAAPHMLPVSQSRIGWLSVLVSRRSERRRESAFHKFTEQLDMPPQMDYFYHESRVPSACGLTREDELEPHVISCMLVGDGAVGKTSMIVSYTSNGYPTEYQQTGFDVFSGEWARTFILSFTFFLFDLFIVIQASNKKVTSFLKSLNAINVNEICCLLSVFRNVIGIWWT